MPVHSRRRVGPQQRAAGGALGDREAAVSALRHAVQDVLPDARAIDGWMGIVMLVDRTTGLEKTMTLWESAKALEASEAAAEKLRARAADEAGQRIVSVERFEVPIAFDRAPRLMTV